VVDEGLSEEIVDARTALSHKINEVVGGRSEPETLDIMKILPPLSATDTTIYNSDHVDLRDTPPVEIRRVNLQLSPSGVPLPQVIPDSSPDPPNQTRMRLLCGLADFFMYVVSQLGVTGTRRIGKHSGSQGHAVLVSFMGNGNVPDISREAAMRLLASDDEKDSAVKQALMKATRLLRKMGLKIGLIGWRKWMKEDGVEKGFEEEVGWEGTEEDMDGVGVGKMANGRKELRKKLRKGLL